MPRVAQTLRFFRICLLSLLSVFVVACADVADLPEVVEAEQPATPPAIKDEELDPLKQLFFGQYGCQRSPELSLLNYEPQQVIDVAECLSNVATPSSNPKQLFAMDAGIYEYLDTEVDAEMRPEYLVYANKGGLFQVDIASNTSRRLTVWNGEVCRIIPSTRYEQVVDSGVGSETWYELDAPFVYAEVVFDTSTNNACSNSSVFRNYFKVAMNYDEDADDAIVCSSEDGGKSSAADCKTKQRPIVTEAQALSSVVTAHTGQGFTYGYLGWGRDENDQRSLSLWDESGTLLWRQKRQLESFTSVAGIEGSYKYLFSLDALADTFHLLQLGRDAFVFEGRELFETADSKTLFSDRVYQLEEDAGAVSKLQFVYDEDDLVLFDSGKFFHLDYKASFTPPVPAPNYDIAPNLKTVVQNDKDTFEFSQFELQDCSYVADTAACNAANDVGGISWQATKDCDVGIGCSLPVDLNDYCVTNAEKLPSTPADALCTPERYLDLNELDEAGNDAVFTAFLQYYAQHMRNMDFQMYNNKLLLNLRLTERDALVLYDFTQPATAPATARESLLLGRRLVQSISSPIVQGDDLYINSVIEGVKSSNICYKGFQEVQCNFAKLEEGTSDECTTFDINAGTCREGKYLYESRALYCAAADVSGGACTDKNQINPKLLQVEADTQDAKWLPVISIDDVNGLQKEMRVLVSEDRQYSSNNPSRSYTKEEGVLGNPELYTLAGTRLLSAMSEGQLQGTVESVPSSIILRNGEGAVSVTAEEFVGGRAVRQQDELYVNEATDVVIRVTGSEQEQ